MTDDRWFRNPVWNARVEREFERRLALSRSQRPQYLKIQAGHLTERHPRVSLALIERYFETGDDLFVAEIHGSKARALLRLGRLEDALASYVAALDHERLHGEILTQAYLDFPCLVGVRRARAYYDRAMETLRETRARPTFPVERYRHAGARALLHSERGEPDAARVAAREALDAARAERSGFWRLPSLGLVKTTRDRFGRRVVRLAR